MTRAWAYCRVSTQRQSARGNSLAAQSEEILRFVEYQKKLELDLGAPATREFGEFGVVETRERVVFEAASGWRVPFFRRQVAGKVCDQLEQGDALIVAKLDRLGRNAKDLRQTLDKFVAMGVAVYVLDIGNGDLPVNATQGATSKLLLGILMSMAEFESDRRGERVRESNAARRANGRGTGELPLLLAYASDQDGPKGCLIPCEFNRSRARAFYELYAVHGMWPEQIANAAASAGLFSRGRWSRTRGCFIDGRLYSQSMVRRLIRAEHQVRELAAELDLSEDDDALILAWWERFQSEDENLRRSIPSDCHRGNPVGRPLSPAAVERLLHRLARSPAEQPADVDGLQLAADGATTRPLTKEEIISAYASGSISLQEVAAHARRCYDWREQND